MKTPIKSFKIIKEMYEYFVKKYRDLEPKLMICEKEDLDNVEKALKEYNQLNIDYEELNDIHNKLVKHRNKERDDVVKKLKALEIMKEKKVNLFALSCSNNKETYNDLIAGPKRELTEQEFDLLKEILK